MVLREHHLVLLGRAELAGGTGNRPVLSESKALHHPPFTESVAMACTPASPAITPSHRKTSQ